MRDIWTECVLARAHGDLHESSTPQRANKLCVSEQGLRVGFRAMDLQV